jgi:hypothetical protein
MTVRESLENRIKLILKQDNITKKDISLANQLIEQWIRLTKYRL